MTAMDLVPVGIIAFVPVGIFLRRRLAWLAQPLRMELAEKGEALLASDDLPKEIRNQVRFMLDTAFHSGWMMLLSIIIFPFMGVVALLLRRDLLARALRDYSSLAPAQRAEFYEVLRLHERITTANHPVLQAVLEIEFLILAMIALVVIAVSKSPFPRTLDRSIVVNVMEMGDAKFFHARAHAH